MHDAFVQDESIAFGVKCYFELAGASDVEREISDFAADFALLGFVAVIFGSSGGEFGDGVSVIEFVTNQIQEKSREELSTNQRARYYTQAR